MDFTKVIKPHRQTCCDDIHDFDAADLIIEQRQFNDQSSTLQIAAVR